MIDFVFIFKYNIFRNVLCVVLVIQTINQYMCLNGNTGMNPMAVRHAPTDIGNKDPILVNISASNVTPNSKSTGRPRGRLWGRSLEP